MSKEDELQDDGSWRIGELAERTGVSVRTLHHYDQIGLLHPSGRAPSGHRRYSDEDVAKLHAILALRSFGLALSDIGEVLDDEVDVRSVLEQQVTHLGEQVRLARRLRQKIATLLESGGSLSAHDLFDLMEGMTEMTKQLSAAEYETAIAQRNQTETAERDRLNETRRKTIAARGDASLAEARANRDRLIP